MTKLGKEAGLKSFEQVQTQNLMVIDDDTENNLHTGLFKHLLLGQIDTI